MITIFFDILALEFVQKLDDVAYDLSRKEIFGNRLLVATMKEYKVLKVDALEKVSVRVGSEDEGDNKMALTEQQEKEAVLDKLVLTRYQRKIRCRFLLKVIFFMNLALLLIGIIAIGDKQDRGVYLCNSVTVIFGDHVWENALVKNKTDPAQSPYETTLVYSYFNGIYKLNGTFDGYPKFTEQNKVDGTVFRETVGAEIKYCKEEGSWLFMHRDIVKRGHSDEVGVL